MKPLRNIHLKQSNHLSKPSIGKATLKSESIKSMEELNKPKADNEFDIDVKAAAAMCQYAYSRLSPGGGPEPELIDGWEPMLKDIEIKRLIAPGKLQNKSIGFSSMLFQKQVNGIQYYAYCTVGTDELIDWVSNGTQFFTGLATQYTYSVQLAKQIDNTIGNKGVLWFIGHSLGGGLASNNSLVTGRHAITFNAAGLNFLRVNATLMLNNWKDLFHPIERTQRVHAFVIKGEMLNSILRFFGQSAYGRIKPITLNQGGISMRKKHSMTTILDYYGIKYK